MRFAVAAACAASLFVAGCGSSGGGGAQSGATGLVVTRDDGSRVEFDDTLWAWCGPADDLRAIPGGERALHVVGGELPRERGGDASAFWFFSRRLGELERQPSAPLTDTASDGVAMFVLDGETENELASDQLESTGTVEVEDWGCEQGDTVRITFDGTLGSEFGNGPSVMLDGEVEAKIGDPPDLPQP